MPVRTAVALIIVGRTKKMQVMQVVSILPAVARGRAELARQHNPVGGTRYEAEHACNGFKGS